MKCAALGSRAHIVTAEKSENLFWWIGSGFIEQNKPYIDSLKCFECYIVVGMEGGDLGNISELLLISCNPCTHSRLDRTLVNTVTASCFQVMEHRELFREAKLV